MKKEKIDQTFLLIKSLEKKEITFFKKFAKLNSKNKDPEYLQLFESLLKMKTYNEAALQGKNFYKNLHYNKNYLFNQITRSLRLQFQESSKEKKIRNLIDESEIFKSKNLFYLAKKQLDKANNLITNTESFYINYELKNYNFRIKKNKNLEERIQSIKKHIKDSKKLLKGELQVLQFQELSTFVNDVTNKFTTKNKEASIKVIEDIISNKKILKLKKKNIYTDHSLSLQYYTKAICYSILTKEKKALKFQLKSFNLLLKNKAFVLRPSAFISSLTSTLNFILNLKKYDLFEKYILYYKKVPISKSIATILFERELVFYTRFYLESKQYSNGLVYIEEKKHLLQENIVDMNTRRKAEIVYSFGLIYFFNNEIKKASNCFDTIENSNNNEKSFYKDILMFSKILNLFCHIELGNFAYSKNCYSKLKTIIKKQSFFPDFEKAILTGFNKLIKLTTKNEINKEYINLYHVFIEFKTNKIDIEFLEYFNILEWLKLKTQKND